MAPQDSPSEAKTAGREKERRRLPVPLPAIMVLFVILAYVVIFIIVTLDWTPPEEKLCDGETGGYCYGDPAAPLIEKELTSTSITICFGGGFDRNPHQFEIFLGNSTSEGTYYFPSSGNGTVLILKSGTDVGTVTYMDNADNGKINVGDCIILENLEPDTYFSMELVYVTSGKTVCFYCFSTPPQ